ncbi:MAG: aldehyde dehydrogenase family protein, partial [Gammaproteobacteria bacterium]|nr:aldehyde dehydrogenase family protein [Gammaproteobacteria bacterium]
MEKIANYIDGALKPPAEGNYLENFEPATGRVYSKIPQSGKDDLELAVASAKRAFPGWSSTPAEERAHWLNKIADLIDANAAKLAEAETRDNGKPITLARSVDIPRASANFRFYAGAATQFFSESH